mmetsp:Transcript_44086/g.95629  ORF Transcript_44086/g.95629 Transcript_44086/m.95629 type:complete len:315 (+) Transcript_44086:52-996(+)|eukprot:CAMPEP_0117019284 /NCGR_PEP_ID=MMETSP0472-20121206/14824_1 /TAXON_ID=693140 ORGANISM="Tiarina fusus, Strain LIS" /NCGR_SAMPLE_ID=MMETSP0472 /ASSEMBLY_ACC=CAM_ASM_000603 /LENGTH=314 /DNA_ID=CAMNT_0004724219 /DNA_START=53 /DNA_END=994 /DNA_ORIENTATION=+
MAEKFSEQIRACGLFFISIVVLVIIPLVYHCFVVVTCIPMLDTNPASGIVLLVFFHLLLILMLVSYWKTIFTEPGFVPYTYDEAWLSELHLASRFGLEADATENVIGSDEPNVTVTEKKRDGRQRKCGKCKKIKPDRAHHCKYCGRCVLKMDHHCPWVNNCIGFRNYKFFMLFCMYCTLAAFYVTVTLFSGFIAALSQNEPIEFGGTEMEYLFTFLLMATTSTVLLGFTGFHLMLVCKNMSTIEHLEKRDPNKKDQENPFDLGRSANWKQVFGDNPLLWFIPVGEVKGNGVDWNTRSGMSSDAYGRGDLTADVP